ncbi:MAG TPA: hypothetical protein VGR43_06215, partial [Dehalococcoidia bacterium]|nr:hypothetical protein [Dehalococcoidia bacterium]
PHECDDPQTAEAESCPSGIQHGRIWDIHIWRGESAAIVSMLNPQPIAGIDPEVGVSFFYPEGPLGDADGDYIANNSDNCVTTSNADQANFDGDAPGDVCDSDDDSDGVNDTDEPACGGANLNATRRPERVDGPFAGTDDDGDAVVDESLPTGSANFDCDGDGFNGSAEDHVYSYLGQTNGDQKTCQQYDSTFPNPAPHVRPSKRWPADLASGTFSGNKINIQDLSSFTNPIRYLNQDVGTDSADVRFDLTPGSTFGFDINVADMAALTSGASGYPPMLGARAFGGPACPYTP